METVIFMKYEENINKTEKNKIKCMKINQKDLDKAKDNLATVLNTPAINFTNISTTNLEPQSNTRDNVSVFKEPTAITNIPSSSSLPPCIKTNDISKKTPNQTQFIELLDTTEEFEALEAQCASPPVNDATLKPIQSTDQTPNKSTANYCKFIQKKKIVDHFQWNFFF